jgi:hypothetical protein
MKIFDLLYEYRPNWHNFNSHCRVRVYQTEAGLTVMLTETQSNKGMSVTNAAELIACGLVERFSLDITTTRWIEHYPPARIIDWPILKDDSFDLITFAWNGRTANDVEWRRISRQEAELMIGESTRKQYRPSPEKPIEPGVYWWRSAGNSSLWIRVTVLLDGSRLWVRELGGQEAPLDNWVAGIWFGGEVMPEVNLVKGGK